MARNYFKYKKINEDLQKKYPVSDSKANNNALKYSGGDLQSYYNNRTSSFKKNLADNFYTNPYNKGAISLDEYYKVASNNEWLGEGLNQREMLDAILGKSEKRDKFFKDQDAKKRVEGDIYGKVDEGSLSPIEKFNKDYKEKKSSKTWSALDKYTDNSGMVNYKKANEEIDSSIKALGGTTKKEEEGKTLFDDFRDLSVWLNKKYNKALLETSQHEMDFLREYTDNERGLKAKEKELESIKEFVQHREERLNREDIDRGFLSRIGGLVSTPGGIVQSFIEPLSNQDKNSYGVEVMKNLSDSLSKANVFSNKVSPDMDIRTSDTFDNLGWEKMERINDYTGKKGKDLDDVILHNIFSDLNNASRGVLGFAGDILTDPLTYLSGGVGSGIKDFFKGTGANSATGFTEASSYLDEIGVSNASNETVNAVIRKLDKLKGVNHPKDITFGLGNTPFIGSKFKDPKVLVKGETIASLGDETIAPIFNKGLQSAKGSKFASLFSNDANIIRMINKGNVTDAGILTAIKQNDKLRKLTMEMDNTEILERIDQIVSRPKYRKLYPYDAKIEAFVETPFTNAIDPYRDVKLEKDSRLYDDVIGRLEQTFKPMKGNQVDFGGQKTKYISNDLTNVVKKLDEDFIKNQDISNYTLSGLKSKVRNVNVEIPDDFKTMSLTDKQKLINRNMFKGDVLSETTPEFVLDDLINSLKNKDESVINKYYKYMPEYLDGTDELHGLIGEKIGYKNFNKDVTNMLEKSENDMRLLLGKDSKKMSASQKVRFDEMFKNIEATPTNAGGIINSNKNSSDIDKILDNYELYSNKYKIRNELVKDARTGDTEFRKNMIKELKGDKYDNIFKEITEDMSVKSSDVGLEGLGSKRYLKETDGKEYAGTDFSEFKETFTPSSNDNFDYIKNKVDMGIPVTKYENSIYKKNSGSNAKVVIGVNSPVDLAKKERLKADKLRSIDSEESAKKLYESIFGKKGDSEEVIIQKAKDFVEESSKFDMNDAHLMTRGMKRKYPDIDYDFQLGLNMKYLKEGGKPIFVDDIDGEQLFMKELFKTDKINKNIEQVSLTDGTYYMRVSPIKGIEEFARPTSFMDNMKLSTSLDDMLKMDEIETMNRLHSDGMELLRETTYKDARSIDEILSSPGYVKNTNKFSEYKNHKKLSSLINSNKAMYRNESADEILNMFGTKIDANVDFKSLPKGDRIVIKAQDFNRAYYGDNVDMKKIYKQFGIKPSSRTGYSAPIIEIDKKGFAFDAFSAQNIPIYSIKKEAMEYTNSIGISQYNQDSSAIMRLYDKFMGMWKKGHTIYTPSFQIKNAVGNSFNNYLNVGSEALKPANHKEAMRIISGKDGIVDINGVEHSYSYIRDLMSSEGLLDIGFISSDMKKGFAKGFESRTTKKLNSLGSAIENHDKALNFIANLRNGLSIGEASEMTNKYLFDYSDITTFERNVMRRLIPFYTYARKNIPLQIGEALTNSQPYAHLNSLAHAINTAFPKEEIDEDYMAKYAKNYWQTPKRTLTEDGREQYLYAHFGLPYEDMTSVGNAGNSGDLKEEIFGRLTPALTIPYEISQNRNYYFDEPIKKYPDHKRPVPLLMDYKYIGDKIMGEEKSVRTQVDPRMAYFLEQMLPASSKLSKVTEKTMEGDYKKLIDYITGLKLYEYDPEKEKHRALQDIYYKLKDKK